MKKQLEKTVEALAKKAREADKACDAQQYAQAMLNVVHCLATLNNMK